MTREEAIRILDPETTGQALAEIEYYGGFRGRAAVVQAVLDACVLAVAALREQEERRWIPVEERLPEDDLPKDSKVKQIKVFVAYKTNGRWVERTQIRVKGYWYSEPDKWSWVKTSDPISHWMPLTGTAEGGCIMEDVKDYPPYLDYPKPRKTTTNAQRIRAMPDEELASPE